MENKKYKLINITTKEETLCEKVEVDGFQYYVSDKIPYVGEFYIHIIKSVGVRLLKRVGIELLINAKKIICSNNPKIDLPKVVNVSWKEAVHYQDNVSRNAFCDAGAFQDGYLKSQSTHPFSDEDMVEFADWILINDYEKIHGNRWCKKFHSTYITSKELLQLFKDQQIKTVYYGN